VDDIAGNVYSDSDATGIARIHVDTHLRRIAPIIMKIKKTPTPTHTPMAIRSPVERQR